MIKYYKKSDIRQFLQIRIPAYCKHQKDKPSLNQHSTIPIFRNRLIYDILVIF